MDKNYKEEKENVEFENTGRKKKKNIKEKEVESQDMEKNLRKNNGSIYLKKASFPDYDGDGCCDSCQII